MRSSVLTPRELAEAIGVSESSVKRWADEGLLRAGRTAGGHRRIAVREAVRFVRETGSPVLRPHVLGLPEVARAESREPDASDGEILLRWLREGEGPRVRGLLQSLYLEGASVASLVDGPVRSALAEIGELWLHGEDGIFEEHRALDVALQALRQLGGLLREGPPAGAPAAVGGAPSGDPYLVPTLGVSMVLHEAGYRAVNLGPDSPAASLLAAARRLGPRLVWLSVSSKHPEDLAGFLRRLLDGLPSETRLVIGGRELRDLDRVDDPRLVTLGSMAELEGFVRELDAEDDGEAERTGSGS